MEFTGERVIPGQGDVDLLNEHCARYWFARRFAAGKRVLDAACGTGYGSAMLAETARVVVGVDLARDAIEYARQHFASPKVRFAQTDCRALPFPNGRFDLVVAFEIIEHLDNAAAFLGELRRVLHPSGLLILSTPNRLYYTDERQEINPFHTREFSYPELEEILRPLFPHRAILFENHVAGLAVAGPEAKPNLGCSSDNLIVPEQGATTGIEEERRGAHFFIAVCSAHPLPSLEPLLYLPSTGNVLREREFHLRSLQEQLAGEQARLEEAGRNIHRLQQREEELARLLEQRTQWARELNQRLSEKDAYLLPLQADYDQKVAWAQTLEQDLNQARGALDQLRQEFEERSAWALKLNAELEERTAWALRLDAELKERSDDLRLLYGSRWYRLGKNLKLSPVPPSDRGPSQAGPR